MFRDRNSILVFLFIIALTLLACAPQVTEIPVIPETPAPTARLSDTPTPAVR